MYAGLTLVTPPAGEPVSVADAKAHSRVTVSADDGMMAGYIAAARVICEKSLRRALLPQTWRQALRFWPGRNYQRLQDYSSLAEYYKWNFIELPRPPLRSITSFTYTDTAGNVASMQQGYGSQVGNYLLDTESEPGRVYLPFSGVWPTTILAPGAPILITYVAGYSSFSGTVNTDQTGLIVSWASGDKFDASLAGSFIQVAGVTGTVLSVNSNVSLTLQNAVGQDLTGAAYTGNAVPHGIKQAILLLAGHFYANREAVAVDASLVELPFAVDSLLEEYRNRHSL